MKRKSLLFLLLMAAFAPWAAAQQSLPYSYGFEDNNLATNGWTSTGGAIYSGAAYNSSSYGYRFSYSISSDVFLMSPILTGGTNGVNVSFYYKAYSGSYLDHFYVGYTTDQTVTDPSAFTYGTMVTSSTSWQLYEEALPAGTVRVAIKYDVDNYDDGYYLYLDDFSFTAASSCAAPTNALATYTSGTTATVTWDGSAASYNINVNGTITSGVSSPYVLNVAPATTYTVKVQADCGSEQSAWVNAGTFTTDCPTSFSIPYTYGFENESGINCWTIEPDNDGFTGVQNNTWAGTNLGGSYARTGEGFFFFFYTDTPPHYLISPLLSGISNGLHVEFWYRQYTNGVETFQVGYSTTDNDPSSFTWDAEVTASTTYQRYSANYPAGTKYVAVMLTSDDQYYLFLDDFVFEESASCLEPTAVTVTNETTNSATVNWTAGGAETEWDIFVTDDATIVPDDATTPTIASTSTKPYPLTGLTPGTIYYVYVRAICSNPSAWSSPAIFNTKCEGVTLPYSYDFQDNELPVCWSTINTNTSYLAIGNMAPSSSSTNRVLYFYRGSSTGTLVAVLPEVDSHYQLNGYQITFDACYANGSGGSMTAGKLGIGIMNDPTDFTSFELIEEIDITDGFSTYGSHTVMFNNYTGHGQYIAIQDIYTQGGYVLVDNIEVTELPACIPPTNVTISGGANAVLTWDGSATSYQVAYATDGTVNPDDYIISTDVTATTFDLSTYVAPGDNYVWVRSNCGTDHSVWVDTYLDLSYCTPNPTSHDGSGITAVSFGTGSNVVTNGDGSASLPASSPYYGDYTSMIGAVNAGVASTISITTSTGSFPYTFVIWVDLDNSYTFDDSEILYIGKASSGNGTLNATITVPATQALGDYRMRIYGADSYFTSFYGNGTTNWSAAHDPCSSGTYRHAHDYTLRVLAAPSCLAPSALGADHISTTSADLSWTANSGETAWTIYYKKTSETTYTEEPATTNPYTLTGLDPATEYEYYVVANCSSTETSDPSVVFNFFTSCGVITSFPWSEDFEARTTGNFSDPCWVNEHISGSGTYIFQVSTNNAHGTSTKQLQLPDMSSGTMTKLRLPEMTLPGDDYLFVIDVFRNATGTSYTSEGVRVYASADGEITGATELGFLYRNYTQTDGGVVVAESASGWYTYEFPIGFSGTCYIILQGESKYGSATYLDNFKVKQIPSCLAPTDLAANNITTTSADLSWTANSGETAWTIYYKKASETTYTKEPANANPYTLNGLDPATTYDYYVVANCSSTDESEPSAVFSFNTDCEAVTTFPWTEDFEARTTGSFSDPCWVNEHISGSGTSIFQVSTSNAHGTSTKQLQLPDMYSGTMTKLMLPEMTLPGDDYQFVIDVFRNASGTSYPEEGVRVYASTNGEITGATELGFLYRNCTQTDGGVVVAESTQGWYTYEFPIGFSGTCYIILQGESKYGSATYLDNFKVRQIPSCLAPTDLAAGNITTTSADLSWTANSGETAWTIYYKKASETTYTEEPATTNPYTLSGLDHSTTYDYYVVANCSSTDESEPSAVFSFNTDCEAVTTFPWTEDFESFSASSSGVKLEAPCWENIHLEGTGAYFFEVYTGTNGTNSTKQLRLHDMADGTMTKLRLPEMTLPNANFQFTIDVYRSSSYSGKTGEGIRVFASTDGEITGATELAFIPRYYDVASGVIPAESTGNKWYTYSLPIGISGTCYIILRGESQYGTATYMDNFAVEEVITLTKTITGYGTNVGGYVLLATPVKNVDPVNANMIDAGGDYDLFSFDQAYASEEWRNYKQSAFNLESGKGYLYASKNTVTLTFTGVRYTGDGKVDLAYDASKPCAGWNLIGNPFTTTATITQPYYRLNSDGSALNATTETSAIAVMEGVFVEATAAGQATFTAASSKGGNAIPQTNILVSNEKGALLDNAIVRFDNGQQLGKFSLNDNSSVVYIPQDGKDYAIIAAKGNVGEIPVSFKAETNGSYTLSFTAQEVSFSYLHLIDNLTGADVDLLANPSYSFDAQYTDYAQRFRLVFATGSSVDGDSFGFINGSGNLNIFGIEGEATVQLMDVTGRILSSDTFSGSYEKKLNVAPGVYMLRLINGNDVKVQKIVVR